MNIKTIASGSKGNCYSINDGQTSLLIEAGIPYKKLFQGVNFNLSSYVGCLLSHEHLDHAKAIPDLIKAGINIYTSKGTAQALGISGYRVKAVEPLKPFSIGTFTVIAFDTKHDVAQPFGYVVKSTVRKESLCFVTDSYYVESQFKNIDFYIVECNYITELLMNSDTPPDLQRRLLQSHMSLETCIKFLQAQDLTKCKRIYLAHISAQNGDANIMCRDVARATGKEVVAC